MKNMLHRAISQIGDHMIEFVTEDPKAHSWIQRQFRVEEPHECSINLTIFVKTGYGEPFVNYEVLITEDVAHLHYKRADYYIKVNKNFNQAMMYVFNQLAFKHALMNLYSSLIVEMGWGLLLHASCVIEEDQCHLFAGHSGAGKSTAAKLSHPRKLLSDEATILKVQNDSIIVYDSPFRSEIERKDNLNPMTLTSIHILHQAMNNQRIFKKKADAFIQLIDKVFYWPHSKMDVSKIMNALHQIVQQIPVYDLHFQKNNAFWELIS